MRQTCATLVIIAVLTVLGGCGGSPQLPAELSAGADFALRAVDGSGRELPADSVSLTVLDSGAVANRPATADGERCLVISALSDEVLGVEVSYDPARWHVAAAERGDYFSDDDLFLAVTDTAGCATVGGYHLVPDGVRSGVLARITLSAGPAPRSVQAVVLPTGEGCTPRQCDYIDNGDGSVTFSWQYNCTGDYNQDGLVYITDITPVGQHYNANHSSPDWLAAQLADGNEDDYITVADLTPIGQHYNTALSGYILEQASAAGGPFSAAATVARDEGVADPRLSYTCTLSTPLDGDWYRVRAYHTEDDSQGAACAPLQLSLLPPGDNPVAVAAADVLSGEAPLTVNFSDGGSSDADGVIEQWLWDLDNDLQYEIDATADSGAVAHVYDQAGTYFARLKVVDNDGRWGVDALTISVGGASEPPDVQAYCMPNQGWAPLTVYFSPFGSTDPDGTIDSYQWDLDGDGLYETDATAAGGYAQYTYSAAGEYSARLQVTDDSGAQAVTVVPVSVRDPAQSTVDYWSVFDQSRVRRVDLSVSQANWDIMWADVNAEVEVEADAVVFGTSLASIGLRMKGNSSLNNPSQKKPWKIDTNQFIDTQEYENLKMLIFNNGFKDPSLARESLAYRMMAFAGVPASHTCMVEIWISVEQAPAEFWGVYTMVERVDEKYIFNRFGNKGGNLYKGTHQADLSYRGDDIAAYPVYDGEPCYAKHTNEDEADYSDILEFLRVLNNTPDETFSAGIEPLFNVDGYLRYLAVTLLHSNLDIHMYMDQNFYLYSNEATGRFEWIPWDLNEAWGQFGDGSANQNHALYQLMNGVGGPGTPHNVLFERVLAVPQYRQALAAYYDLLLRYDFEPDAIAAQAHDLHDLVESYVKQGDRMYVGQGAMYDYADFDQNWQQDVTGNPGPGAFAFGIRPFTQTRRDYAELHLQADL